MWIPRPPTAAAISLFDCPITFNTIGARTVTATFAGSSAHSTSSSASAHTVNQATTTTSIVSITPASSQVVGIPYSVRVSVLGGAAPTGNVTVGDGVNSCVVALPGTTCALISTTTSAKIISATYAGDTQHAGSTANTSYTINTSPGLANGLQVGAVVLPATAAAPAVNPTVTVTFPQPFNAPLVVIVQASDENAVPQALRIRNVTATGFQVLQVTPPGCASCNGSSGTATVHWLAATPGRYRLPQDTMSAPAWLGTPLRGVSPGALVIVGTLATSATQYNPSASGFSSWPAPSWGTVSWPSVSGLDFAAPPAVLSTVQSWANEGADLSTGLVGASEPWATSVTRNISTGGFQIALDAGEVSADDLAPIGFDNPEVIGYLALEAGLSQSLLPLSGPPAVGLTSSSTLLNAGVPCTVLDLGFPIGTPITAANFRGFGGKQSRAIADGGWLRRCQLVNPSGTSVRVGLRRDEDGAFDRSPVTDQASVVSFSGNLVTTPVTLAQMAVQRESADLRVSWSTATEVAQLGFRLWGRARGGEWQLLTPELIGATAGERMSAASYSARVAAAGVDEVRLEDVDVRGNGRFHPALQVGEARGSAPTKSAIDWSAIRAENAAVLAARSAAPTSATASALARVRTDGMQRIAGSALIALDARFAGAPASSLAVLDGERPVWRHVRSSSEAVAPR